jgi:hypothetical protein
MTHHTHSGGMGTGDWLVGAVKRNPEGLLLLAAGCALLLRSGGSAGSMDSVRRTVPEGVSRATDRARGVTDRARSYASDLRDNVAETASAYASKATDYASKVGDYAEDARQNVADQSGRIAAQAQSTLQSTVDRVLQRQPLAIALAGLAVGAAVAAAFPQTDIEERTLGPAGERLSEAAAEAGRQLNEAASAAGERLKSAAEERGLSAEGLKEMASEVAGTFGETLKGEGNPSSTGGGGRGSSGPTGHPG